MEKIKIINKSGYPLPAYQTPQSAGCDLYAVIEHPKLIQSLDRASIPTGISNSLPEGYEAQVRPRSGLTRKNGIVAAVGTIDADYRGEIGVTLFNLSREPYTVHPGDRIAQLVISKCEQAEWDETDALDNTERGEGGFGHTGR